MTEPPVNSTAHAVNRMAALDGVRTIAVFLVVLFHVSTPGFGAGFIGVDIFFVLSGYLITSGLVREADRSGRIHLGNFWLRRFKRLMPAALLLLIVLTVVMFFFTPLFAVRTLSGDLWWTLTYLANWHLMAANSYFADTGAPSPLLHMWSLAVEEQFYVLWPLLLFAVLLVAVAWSRSRGTTAAEVDSAPRRALDARGPGHTFNRVAGWLTLGLIVASAVALAVLYDPASPDRAYMGTDTKAFEPLLGALAAIALTSPRLKAALAARHRLVAVVGLAIMAVLFPFLDGPAPFYYQWGALVFSVGALLLVVGLVLAQGTGLLSRVLGWEPVAYLGRISYGIYLWHWPFAIWLIGDLSGFRWVRAAAVIGATVAAAALSYHLVEMPVRTRKWFTAGRSAALAVGSLVVMLVAVSFGGGTPLSAALVGALPETNLNRSVLMLVGDSVPQRFSPQLEIAAKAQGFQLASATGGGCPPSGIDYPLTEGEPDIQCWPVLDTQKVTLAQFSPATVVWWSRYELANMRVDGRVVTPEEEEFWEVSKANLVTTAERLTADGATLVLIETDRVGVGVLAQCTPENCHPFIDRLAHHDEYRQRWNQLLRDYAAAEPKARVVSVDDLYCHDDQVPCDDLNGGVPARKDGSHFSDPAVMPDIAKGVIARVLDAAARPN